VNKTNSEFLGIEKLPVYADFFGFTDLKVFQGGFEAEDLEEMFASGL
jgi:hypothetical protein